MFLRSRAALLSFSVAIVIESYGKSLAGAVAAPSSGDLHFSNSTFVLNRRAARRIKYDPTIRPTTLRRELGSRLSRMP